MSLSRGFYMNNYYDANALFEAGTKSIKGSRWKYSTQLFEMNQLLETAKLQKALMEGKSRPAVGSKFVIKERGKTRYISSATMQDKTVNHIVCDKVLTPYLHKYLQYDNSASQKGKGVSFMENQVGWHGKAPNDEEYAIAMAELEKAGEALCQK